MDRLGRNFNSTAMLFDQDIMTHRQAKSVGLVRRLRLEERERLDCRAAKPGGKRAFGNRIRNLWRLKGAASAVWRLLAVPLRLPAHGRHLRVVPAGLANNPLINQSASARPPYFRLLVC